jgi:hypothetical protein
MDFTLVALPPWRSLKVIVLLLAILFSITIAAIWVLPTEARTSKPGSSPNSSTGTATAGKPASSSETADLFDSQNRLNTLKEEISNQDKAIAIEKEETSHLNDLSRLLMTIAGVFTFLLGAASWKTLEDQRKLARETLESQKKLFDAELKTLLNSSKNLLDETLQQSSDSLKQTVRLRDEVERDFPMFGRMGSNFSKVLTGLAAACSKLKMDDETYKTLSRKEEQRILFYESAMSTSMLLDTESRAKELSEIYRLLGIFYGSKFCSSLPDGEFSKSTERNDFYRSQFYFERAIEIDDKNYLAYLSAGYFTQYNDDLSIAEIARGYLESAAVLGPRFQKPVYMIALIELEAHGDADKALEVLELASQRPEYDILEREPKQDYIEYVKACAYCLKLKANQSPTEEARIISQRAITSLELACARKAEYVRKAFANERRIYFDVIEKSPELKTRFESVVATLETSPSTSNVLGP